MKNFEKHIDMIAKVWAACGELSRREEQLECIDCTLLGVKCDLAKREFCEDLCARAFKSWALAEAGSGTI